MSSVIARLTTALVDRYRVERELGAGGMATVYLALDLKHDRDVAIKVLHPDFGAALGGERFLAEIKTTAKLQHPHILPLLDSGAADGLLYYVMPYVSGETLRARLERERQLPITDAIRIAREVASALEHAHKQGIIHRDIKPENILLQDGAAVVADFGIALAVQTAGGARLTQTGLSVGTPSYMSPEQATGERSIDARSDIYALGAVTYEMLTGEPPFSGPTVQAVVARLLSEAPRSIALQRRAVGATVEGAVLRALEKLPADRHENATAFASALLDDTMHRALPASATAPSTWRVVRARRVVEVLVAGMLVAAALGWWLGQRRRADAPSARRLAMEVTLGQGARAVAQVAMSRDGRVLALIGQDSVGRQSLYLRDLSLDSSRAVTGTDGAQHPSFSPDGKSLVFVDRDDNLVRLPAEGGVGTVLARSFSAVAHWGDDGWIYFPRWNAGLARVRETGGAIEPLTELDTVRAEFAQWDPQLLPDGKHLLYYTYAFPVDSSRVEVLELATKKRTTLVSNAMNPRYVTGGYLTFLRNGAVMVVKYDAGTLQVNGVPATVRKDVYFEHTTGSTAYTVSDDGTLVYFRGSVIKVQSTVREIGRDGREGAVLTPVGFWAEPRLSPDMRMLAVTRSEPASQIWLLDRARGALSQLTSGPGVNYSPNWTPDGRAVVHLAETPVYNIFRTAVDGSSVDTLLMDRFDKIPTGVGPDGRTIAFTHVAGDSLGFLIEEGGKRRVVMSGASRGASAISPDGQWVAYQESSPGRDREIVVQSMNGPRRVQLSSKGGVQPRWTKGGREVVYRQGDAFLAVSFEPASGDVGQPTELFRRQASGSMSDGRTAGYDVSPDGSRFFLVVPQLYGRSTPVSVIFNWRGDLERALRP